MNKTAWYVVCALIAALLVILCISYANAAEITIRRYETIPYSMDPQVQQYYQPNAKAVQYSTGTAKLIEVEPAPDSGCDGFLILSGDQRNTCVPGNLRKQ